MPNYEAGLFFYKKRIFFAYFFYLWFIQPTIRIRNAFSHPSRKSSWRSFSSSSTNAGPATSSQDLARRSCLKSINLCLEFNGHTILVLKPFLFNKFKSVVKRQLLGLSAFIGELYSLSLIREVTVHACLRDLLKKEDPEGLFTHKTIVRWLFIWNQTRGLIILCSCPLIHLWVYFLCVDPQLSSRMSCHDLGNLWRALGSFKSKKSHEPVFHSDRKILRERFTPPSCSISFTRRDRHAWSGMATAPPSGWPPPCFRNTGWIRY